MWFPQPSKMASEETTSKRSVRLLITDLDNTLYDWVSYFSKSFSALITSAEILLGTPKSRLLEEFKLIHQHHHNTEHPFALLEIKTVCDKFPNLSRREKKKLLDPAFYAFNKERKTTLRAYEGVERTLSAIAETGCLIVGHTEATVPNAIFRLKSLGLDQYLAKLFAIEPPPLQHPDPDRLEATKVPNGFVIIVPREKRKPNPSLLLDICSSCNIDPSEAVYVGDSLTRDVGMAKTAGITSAWAKYGTKFSRESWDLLVQVTHWTKEDVAREAAFEAMYKNVSPDVILESFDELLDLFKFTRCASEV
jgi:FMN phosphatase YigB (HAD superfamily)